MSSGTLSNPNDAASDASLSAEASIQKTCAGLWEARDSATNRFDFLDRSVKLLASHFGSPLVMMALESSSGVQNLSHRSNDKVALAWGKHCDGMALEARYRKLSKAKFFRAEGCDVPLAVLAAPMQCDGIALAGSVALVTAAADKTAAEIQLNNLQTFVSLIGTLAGRLESRDKPAAASASAGTGSGAGDTSTVTKASAYQSMSQFAYAIVNNLKVKLNCDMVCLGFVKGQSTRLFCISGLSQNAPRSAGTRLIEQVMDECLDAQEIVCYQREEAGNAEETSTGHLLHRRWSNESAGVPVASIPLVVEGECFAILTLRASDKKNFTDDQLKKIQELATPLMPGLKLLERADRTVVQHMKQAIASGGGKLFQRGAWGIRLALLLMLAGLGWFACGKQDYWLAIPCELVPIAERHVAAPFEGVIESVLVRPGETVAEGDVLLRMDTRQLLLDQQRAVADLRSAELELRQAASKNDIAAAAQAQTRAASARSQYEKVSRNLRQSELTAPQAGVVVSGDLQPRVGEVVPMGELLLRLAPAGQWKLKLRLPEFAATLMQEGNAGTFATLARPNLPMDCQVKYLYGEAEVIDGKNIVCAEAELSGDAPNWARAGMDGYAKINVGRYPVWWVWLHRVIDSARIQFWKL